MIKQCENCGYIFNAAFDNEKMSKAYFSGEYITPKAISNTISKNIDFLKNELLDRAGAKSVFLEIAPGACDLLLALAKNAHFAYSVDPSFTPELLLKNEPNISHIRALFSLKALKGALKHKINFIIFRHLIEHIEAPSAFLRDVVRLLENDGFIYIETPNGADVMDSARFYEIRHEHCAYYLKETLINEMSKLNCEFVKELKLANNQWFGLIFQKKNKILSLKKQEFKIYDQNLSLNLKNNILKLEKMLENYDNIAIYGAGSHANSMLNYLSLKTCLKIKIAIDKDERRQNTFLQKSNIKILAPTTRDLKGIECIIMAMPVYEKIVFEKEIKPLLMQNKQKVAVIFSALKLELLECDFS